MSFPAPRRLAAALVTVAGLLAASTGPAAAAAPPDPGSPATTFWVDPDSSAAQAAATLGGRARADALRLARVPTATWLTDGTPEQVRAEADRVVTAAAAAGQVPVLVAYDLPFRDCAQYSAGGATSTTAYTAWVDGLAAGIGDRPAMVVLEPDGLGIIPNFTPAGAAAPDWCRPDSPIATPEARFEQLNHAVDALKAGAGTSVYLDGTHSTWLDLPDAADRLVRAGVARADGFFLNASNYQPTRSLTAYGTWLSQCVDLATGGVGFTTAQCPRRPADGRTDDPSAQFLTSAAYAHAYVRTGLRRDVATMPHVVLDTSRNGQGAWTPAEGAYAGVDPEVWCNPPGRGLGPRPTTRTASPLVDAWLWVKVPGESDGQCYRGSGGPTDPERGMVDPAAGAWFPEQARELVALASPAL